MCAANTKICLVPVSPELAHLMDMKSASSFLLHLAAKPELSDDYRKLVTTSVFITMRNPE